MIRVYTMESSDWTENQKGLIKYLDPKRYERIWGKVTAVITEVEPEPGDEVPQVEPETKKEEESAAE